MTLSNQNQIMTKYLLSLFFPFLYITAGAQNTNISGTINKYSKVTAIEYCANRVIVDTPGLFTVGIQVLIIQMQGVSIDQSNSANYGNIGNYNSAGNYEIQTIDSILGDSIKFRYEIERTYDPAHSVQLLPLPVYQTATVNGVLSCKGWEGNTGGILLLKADTLILNDSINISGKGFRGFYENDSSQLCFGNLTDYYYTDSMHAGIKGEGVVQYPYQYGRGKNANGGGGGNNENTGGGGGGNFGHGGVGGQIVYRSFSCQGTGPGVGGSTLSYNDTLNKIFMGGGGGCGHGNNSEGTSGTNGAGICLIIANVIIGNNQYIKADGIDQLNIAGSDGAGGAGAGGTVLLNVNQYVGNISVSARGGIGGSLDNDQLARSCMGPGGGGAGGALWVNQAAVPANVNYSAPGGVNGLNLNTVGTLCGYGATNGALPGDTGGSVTGLVVPISIRPYIRLHATASNDTSLCNNQVVTLSATGISSDTVYYSWSAGQQTSSVSFLATQSGPYSVTVSDNNTCSVIEHINLMVYNVNPNFSPNVAVCSPQNVALSAQNPGTTAVSYLWNTSATTPTISFFADSNTSYSVTVTSDSLSSCFAIDTIYVNVGNLSVSFSPSLATAVCPGNPVTLSVIDSSSVGLTYTWSNSSSDSSITVSPTSTTSYYVTVSAGTGCSATHTFVVNMDYLGSIASPDTTVCPGGPASLNVTVPNVTNVHYLWSNGDSTQQISVSPHSTQAYTVTVSAPNGCTGTATMTVDVDPVRISASPDTIICPGGAALLSANATGFGTIAYQWSNGAGTQIISVSPPADQHYAVTATDSLGCRASDSIVVSTSNNADHLTIQITATPDTSAGPGDSIRLSVTGAALATFVWTPGEYLSDSTVQSPVAAPLRAVSYCVSATDSNNCIAQICKDVVVGIPDARIALPNAFSPNGDGKNDIFKVLTSDSNTVVAYVHIYDRWGKLLYEDNDNHGWDGTFKGVAQEIATYTCYVCYYQILYPERRHYEMGSFDLFR